jgi:hypothetical protein
MASLDPDEVVLQTVGDCAWPSAGGKPRMRFATGFVAIDHFEYPPVRLRGRNWRIRFGPQISGESTTNTLLGNRVIESKEVFITAESETVARRVASDIVGAMTLLEGSSALIPDLSDAFHWQHDPAPNVKRLHAGHWATSGFPLACRIAVRVSYSLRLEYALAKFKLSSETASFGWIDLDPCHSETIPRWHRAEDHVRLATAIVLAYSVLEELELEVRASARNPSSVKGQWNPVVKRELEDRLEQAGIDLSDPVVWSVRGGKSRLEAERPQHLYATSTRTPWTRWDIRDRHVEVVDAIGHASFLRSKVSSHRLKPSWVRMLSAYDVANVQHLARRLFLETLGYWPPYKMLKKRYQPKFA